MGIFDGILLCSDWDGTLSYQNKVSTPDIEALNYFMKEGGMFTISSGRFLPYLAKFFDIIKPNTYLITLNGAIIISPDGKEIIHKGFLKESAIELCDAVIQNNELIERITVYLKKNESSIDFDAKDYCLYREKIINEEIYKILLINNDPKKILEAQSIIQSYNDKNHVAVRSWENGLEILSKDNTKGIAVKKLAKKLNSKLLVCAGDFENDIDMLISADISYATESSPENVKKFAKRITADPMNSGIAKIIHELEHDILPHFKS